MPTMLEPQIPHGRPSLSSSIALSSDERPLPVEQDTHFLQRTSELQKLNEELEAFSWSVSHDLSAPLAHIHASLGLLKRHCGGKLDSVAQTQLVSIQSCADRMSRLTQDLLRLARSSRTELLCSRIDLSQMARDIAAELSARAPTRQVEW